MSFSVGALAKKYESMKSRLGGIKEKSEEALAQGLQAAEVGAAAFGFAYANERFGTTIVGEGGVLQVAKIPADLGAGIALHGLAFLGAAGKYGEHAHNLADGALASYLARQGGKMGRQAAQGHHAAGYVPQYTAGAFGAGAPHYASAYANPAAYAPRAHG